MKFRAIKTAIDKRSHLFCLRFFFIKRMKVSVEILSIIFFFRKQVANFLSLILQLTLTLMKHPREESEQ